MKKACITFLLIAIISLTAIGVCLPKEDITHTEYLRIHVRANSNLETDQTVKYKVKDSVVSYLTPYIAECRTKADAESMLKDNLSNIERVAEKVLAGNGFNYGATASVREEEFPTRVYESLELESGIYDALIIELGSGLGDNWWCVVYPPLCFTGSGQVIYRSKILDIIADFFNKEK